MNPLLASGLVLATAGVVWLQQQNRLHRLQSTSAALSAEVSLARTELDRLSARQQELETNLPRLRATLQEHQTRLTAPAPPLPEPDRSRSAELEGRFPTNQPYFYLPKKLLANFDLEPFEDGQLTAAAAILFQFTESERLAIDQAYQAREDGVVELESAKVERPDPPEPLPEQDGPAYVVARLPSLATELAELNAGFRQSVATVLGEDRSARFLEHADAQAAVDGPTRQPATREYILRLQPGGPPTMTIRFRQGDRTWWHARTYELASAYGLSPFRHLFHEPLQLPNP